MVACRCLTRPAAHPHLLTDRSLQCRPGVSGRVPFCIVPTLFRANGLFRMLENDIQASDLNNVI